MGAAHGFLPGHEPLTAGDFSGGAATVGRLLSGLGFQVTQAVPGMTAGKLVELLSALRPYAALYHAGLWELGGPRPVPPAHGNAPLRWFASNHPASGLPAPVYNLVRYSGEARVAAAATIVDQYLQDADYDAILADAGLADADVADDELPADDVIVVRSRVSVDILRLASARRAVLLPRLAEGTHSSRRHQSWVRLLWSSGNPGRTGAIVDG